MNTHTTPNSPWQLPDLSDTTRLLHRMYAMNLSSHYAHITKEVAQATINTGVIGASIYAVTLCNKTFTGGAAWEIADHTNHAMKVCKACASKAGK